MAPHRVAKCLKRNYEQQKAGTNDWDPTKYSVGSGLGTMMASSNILMEIGREDAIDGEGYARNRGTWSIWRD